MSGFCQYDDIMISNVENIVKWSPLGHLIHPSVLLSSEQFS